MKRILTALVLLSGLFGAGSAVWAQELLKGFEAYLKGFEAYISGDYATALKVWRPLAEQGDALAQHDLGVMYANGHGVTQDLAAAVKWYRKAAEQEYEEAQNKLGYMYASGHGVLEDTIAAHMWFNIAAENGHQNAAKARDIVAEKLSSSDIVKAQQKAKRCMASGYKDCD